MTKKLDIKHIISSIKSNLKPAPKVADTKKPEIKTHRERDMRQEAMDMGSHGAKEIFGGK